MFSSIQSANLIALFKYARFPSCLYERNNAMMTHAMLPVDVPTSSESSNHCCCVTGETCPEVLEAAHIQPHINAESDHPQNGLPLRLDLHALFDAGLITLDDQLRVKVSSHLRADAYGQLADTRVKVPVNLAHQPSRAALAHHWQFIFRG